MGTGSGEGAQATSERKYYQISEFGKDAESLIAAERNWNPMTRLKKLLKQREREKEGFLLLLRNRPYLDHGR